MPLGKKDIANLIFDKLSTIKYNHIYSIIGILIDELIKDLKSGNKIKIGNFGTFFLKETYRKRFMNISTKQMDIFTGNFLIRFKINNNLKKNLMENLDVEKTFGDD